MNCQGKTNRMGLYIIVFLIFLQSCDTNSRVVKIHRELKETKDLLIDINKIHKTPDTIDNDKN